MMQNRKRDCQDNVKLKRLAQKGEEVWVKIISIRPEKDDINIWCSMKLASQYDGRDLDPDNFLLERDSNKASSTTWQLPKVCM